MLALDPANAPARRELSSVLFGLRAVAKERGDVAEVRRLTRVAHDLESSKDPAPEEDEDEVGPAEGGDSTLLASDAALQGVVACREQVRAVARQSLKAKGALDVSAIHAAIAQFLEPSGNHTADAASEVGARLSAAFATKLRSIVACKEEKAGAMARAVFASCDSVRNELHELGVHLEDTS